MKEIAKGVFIEESYPGVTLGALQLPQGLVLIDAPPRPDDGRAWLSALRGNSRTKDRLLINLDAHPDRTIGARVFDCSVLAHNETLAQFRQRTSIFKAQGLESGSEWESLSGLSGLRWLPPGITFDIRTQVNWQGQAVEVVSRPGPEAGACWVELPESRAVFVGDAVLVRQAPFLAQASLPDWLESLDRLLGRDYKRWAVVSGRGGLVSETHIRNFRRALADLHKRLEKIGSQKGALAAIEKLIPKLLVSFDSPVRARAHHSQRLRYGLQRYLHRRYGSVPATALGVSDSN